jgi:DNA-directed RNA polymerase subunit omega
VARVTVEDCLKRVNNHFALVILGAERARQIAAGATPLIACDNKSAVTALREIGAGRVAFKENVAETVRVYVAEKQRLDGENTRGGRRRRIADRDRAASERAGSTSEQ